MTKLLRGIRYGSIFVLSLWKGDSGVVTESVRVRRFLGLLIIGFCVPAGAAELRDVRVWASPESTRIVFDLNGVTQHSLFTLDGPNRVVIDLDGTQRSQALALKIDGKGLVQRVRTAPRDGGALRVVLDVSQAVKTRSFSLQPNENYGFRVVVDLSGDAPAEAETPAPTAPASPPAVAAARAQRSAPAAAAAQPSMPPPKLTEKPIVIAIDAGHGGEDPGTSGRRGVLEKDVTLSVARKLAAMVNAEPGLHAVLIRDGDYYIGLRERTARAKKAHADLFISVHANSFKDPSVRGTAVYVLSPKGATSEHAAMVENRENMADLIGGVNADSMDDTTSAVIADIFQTSAMEASHDAGGRLLDAMGRVNVLQKHRVQQASFVVLKSATFPSVLVETAFLTNDREERLLADPSYQDTLAHSMLDGIKGYFRSYRPLEQVASGGAGRGGPGLTPVAMQSPR